MKLKLLKFLVIISFVPTACKHSSDHINLQDEKEVSNALATTWEAEFMETGSSRNKVPDNLVTQITLKKNGTYMVGVKNGVIKHEGRWSYDGKTNMMNFSTGNGNNSTRILALTGKTLASFIKHGLRHWR